MDERDALREQRDGLLKLSEQLPKVVGNDTLQKKYLRIAVQAADAARALSRCLESANPPAEQIRECKDLVAAIQEQISTAPTLANILDQESREAAGEYSVGDFVWVQNQPGVVTKVSNEKRVGRLTIQLYNGATTKADVKGRGKSPVRKHDIHEPALQKEWQEARDREVQVAEWIDGLIGSEQKVRAWIETGNNDPTCQRHLQDAIGDIRRSFPEAENIMPALQDNAVRRFSAMPYFNTVHCLLELRPNAGDRPREFAKLTQSAYRKVVGDAAGDLLNTLRAQKTEELD